MVGWPCVQIPEAKTSAVSFRYYQRISVLIGMIMRKDRVIPFTMESIRHQADGGHVCIRDLASRGIGIGIELAADGQSRFGGGRRNQLQDHGIAREWLAAPVLAHPGKEPMFNCVPLARSW